MPADPSGLGHFRQGELFPHLRPRPTALDLDRFRHAELYPALVDAYQVLVGSGASVQVVGLAAGIAGVHFAAAGASFTPPQIAGGTGAVLSPTTPPAPPPSRPTGGLRRLPRFRPSRVPLPERFTPPPILARGRSRAATPSAAGVAVLRLVGAGASVAPPPRAAGLLVARFNQGRSLQHSGHSAGRAGIALRGCVAAKASGITSTGRGALAFTAHAPGARALHLARVRTREDALLLGVVDSVEGELISV